METKEFIGTCVENPFRRIETLTKIVENAREITKRTFLKYAIVHPDILANMRQFPDDYTFWKCKNVYYYEWSAIEYFYV